jgi:FKBP-type peptidyl-prolyl cis-trans isomerase 2
MKKSNVRLLALLMGFIAAAWFFAVPTHGAEEASKEGPDVVSEGKSVKVHYTLTVDGKVIDSSGGREPLEFKAGNKEMIPGFEKALMGMKAGGIKSFQVSPQDAYGMEDPRAVIDIPKNQLPPEITPQAGMTLQAQAKNGQIMAVRIVEVKEDVVVMDFNHPLAGKTLNFDVEVLEVK